MKKLFIAIISIVCAFLLLSCEKTINVTEVKESSIIVSENKLDRLHESMSYKDKEVITDFNINNINKPVFLYFWASW